MNQDAGNKKSNDGSEGCPILVGNGVCGEPNSLDIMKQFNRLYEDRLNKVDEEDDCLQAKMKIQEEWIHNLTQQNEMLVRAVQDLESEATERVCQLEEKLQKSAQCLCEVSKKYREHDFVGDLLAEPLQNKENYKEDLQNMLEFVRRIRDENSWSTEGLNFHHVDKMDLLTTRRYVDQSGDPDAGEEERLLNEKDRTVQDLTERLNYYNSFGDVDAMSKELHCRREECESLKQDKSDMRQALTEEVAAKYDEIVLLKKELQVAEERYLQADKQTAFKENIIRELRNEIKQLKQQIYIPEKPLYLSQKSTQSSQTKIEKPKTEEKPYIIVNHSSKKQSGRNTVIYINKDGTVHKEVLDGTSTNPSKASIPAKNSKEHVDECSKCSVKLKNGKSLIPNYKSETDLVNIKNRLKPIKPRSKLPNSGLNRSKTFVDQTTRILNEIEFEELFCNRKFTQDVPVKMHVDYLEKKYSP